jgi:biopolymer transport protein ExbD
MARVRYGIPMLALVLLGPGCGKEPGVPRSEIDALLQRLDAMDRRLDALEERLGEGPSERPAAQALPVRSDDPFARAPTIAEAAIEPGPTITVKLSAAGVEIDGKAVAQDDVSARLRELARASPGARLSLVAEPDVSYDAMIKLMDLAKEAGLADVAISVRVHGEGEGAVAPVP